MSLSSISIRRPVLATVLSLVLIIFGVIGYTFLGVREFPSVDPAIVSVSTGYPGANASEVAAWNCSLLRLDSAAPLGVAV